MKVGVFVYSVGERIKNKRENQGLTLEQVGKYLGVSKTTVLRYETGEVGIKRNTAIKLAEILKTTPAYLMGWNEEKPKSKGIRIPVLGRVQAGIPIEAIEDIIDYEEITPELAATGDFFALQVTGESMAPRIWEGDVVIVRKQPDIDSGSIAVVLVNGSDATIKKVSKHENGIMLIAFNPAIYEPHFYSNKEITTLPVEILGKVVEVYMN